MTERHAEVALLAGDVSMAEGILLQNSLIKEAIHINIQIYNWNRYVKISYNVKYNIIIKYTIWFLNFYNCLKNYIDRNIPLMN